MSLQWNSPAVQIVFALLLVILPLSITEIPVTWKCLLWVVAWGMLIHLGLTFVPGVGKLPIVVKTSLAVGLSAFLVAGVYSPVFTMWREEKAAALTGELEAPPSNAIFADSDVKLQIGAASNGSIFTWTGGNGPIFNIVGDKLSIHREHGKLLLSVDVREYGSGAVVVSITDNKWRVSSAQNVSWDHNYTRNAFEVKDGRGRVVLQVVLMPETVRFQGEWWHEDGKGGRILRRYPYDAVRTGPMFVIMSSTNHPDEPGIEPIFKYPSKEHWGEFVDWFRP